MSSENILELKKNRLTKAKTAIAPMRGYCVQPVPLGTIHDEIKKIMKYIKLLSEWKRIKLVGQNSKRIYRQETMNISMVKLAPYVFN